MELLLYAWGFFHLGNAVHGVLTGRIGFLAPRQRRSRFFPSATWIYREQAPLLFWMVVATNVVFACLILYITRMTFS